MMKFSTILVVLALLMLSAVSVNAQDDEPESTPATVTLDYFSGESIAQSPDGTFEIVVHEEGTALWSDSTNGSLITEDLAFDAMVNDAGQFALLIAHDESGELITGDLADVAFGTLSYEEGYFTRLAMSWNSAICVEQIDFNANRIQLEHEDTAEIECASRFSGDLWSDAFDIYVAQYNESPATYQSVDEEFVLTESVTFRTEDMSLVVNGMTFQIMLDGSFLQHIYGVENGSLTIWTTEGVYTGQLRDYVDVTQAVFEPAMVLSVAENGCALRIMEATGTVILLSQQGYNFAGCDEIDAQEGFELAMNVHPPMIETPPTVHYDMSNQTEACWIRIGIGDSLAIIEEDQNYDEIFSVMDFEIRSDQNNSSFRYPSNLPEGWNGLFNQYTTAGGPEDLISLNGAFEDPESGTPYCSAD